MEHFAKFRVLDQSEAHFLPKFKFSIKSTYFIKSFELNYFFSGTHQTLKRLEVAIEANQKSFVAHPSVQQLLSGIYYDGLPKEVHGSFSLGQ